MTAPFRFTDQKPQYRVALGSIAANGRVLFYATGTTTPKNVYTDPTLGTSLGSTIALDADGRHSEDVWMNGDYRVDVQDSNNVSIPGYPLDYVRNPATGSTLAPPDASLGANGQALFTDGTANGWYFGDVLTIPSQTGNAGKYLTTDGEALSWVAPSAADTSGLTTVSAASSGYTWVNGVLTQWGSDTAPTASSTLITTKAVTFAHAFDAAPYFIGVTPAVAGVTNNSPADPPSGYYTSPTASGFTAGFFCGSENNAGTISITSTVPFTWMAIGPKAAAP